MTPTSDNAYCHADVEVLLYAYRRLLPPASVQKKPVTMSECFSDSQDDLLDEQYLVDPRARQTANEEDLWLFFAIHMTSEPDNPHGRVAQHMG
ncbi:hypothetical protein BofuT4_P058770.1 [Botrytis cinerea T4]|uniref:Uncharacterized protein n=1 Tax=Botryotinia fuckeliana (strain T4) TaxID=999810 RepID=G2XUX7_BOTF4|nr:hypothetical protein BofuT4_P058770.1 [Botrytis cinerea T4]